MAQSDTLPSDAAAPLDADFSDTYDTGGVADGAPLSSSSGGSGGTHDFETDERGIDDVADDRRPLREYLGEQLRLSFEDPVDRMIGAHLIALLCPAGRLTAEPAAIADAMAIPLERIEAVRARMMRFDPVGSVRPQSDRNAWPHSLPSATASIRRWRRCWITSTCWRGANCDA